jgi:hypothetical protein
MHIGGKTTPLLGRTLPREGAALLSLVMLVERSLPVVLAVDGDNSCPVPGQITATEMVSKRNALQRIRECIATYP